MLDFFASLYEWFGLIPFYSTDMGDMLRGWDITCTDYIGTPWYIYIGTILIISTSLCFAFQYYIYDSSRFNKKQHWWIMAIVIIIINFSIAFTIPFNIITAGDFCSELNLSVSDCAGFGLSNALWSFIFFIIISSNPIIRSKSKNVRNTTFWKP